MIRVAAIAAAVLLIALLVWKGSCSGYDSRRAVSEAIAEAAPLKARVEQLYASKAALPKAGDPEFRIDKPKSAQRIEWNPKAGVIITMEGQPYPGKSFAYEPIVQDGRIEWTCRALDIETKYLPAACR
jgi:pilin